MRKDYADEWEEENQEFVGKNKERERKRKEGSADWSNVRKEGKEEARESEDVVRNND